MSTRNELIEDCLLNISGYINEQEQIGSLSGAVTDSATTFTVTGAVYADGVGFEPGIHELGDGPGELVYAAAINQSTGVFSSVRRGFRATTAYAWGSGSMVRSNPRVPRISILREMNRTILSLYPKLYAVSHQTATLTAGGSFFPNGAAQAVFDLTATTKDVLSVQLSDDTQSQWRPSKYWQYLPAAPAPSATGKAVAVRDFWQGCLATATTTLAPTAFSTAIGTNETFAAATGLPDYCEEVVLLGTAFRVMNYLESGQVASRTAEGDLLGQNIQRTTPTKLAQHLFGIYSERLEAAAARLRDENNTGQVHYVG